MAVCRQDMLYKDYTSNPIPTSFLIPDMILRAMHTIRLLRKYSLKHSHPYIGLDTLCFFSTYYSIPLFLVFSPIILVKNCDYALFQKIILLTQLLSSSKLVLISASTVTTVSKASAESTKLQPGWSESLFAIIAHSE